MATPEGKVKAKVKRLLGKYGAYYFMPVQSGFGAPAHDFIVCHHGRFLSIETKARPGMYMTKRQAAVAEQIHEAGGATLLVSGDDSLRVLEIWLRLTDLDIKDYVDST